MIKSLPQIYPNESFYSYLSRIFSHSGYIWHMGVANEIFKRPTEYINFNFLNVMSDEFKNVLFSYISPMDLILNHTLCKHYVRFVSEDKKEIIIRHLLNNENFVYRYLPIPINKNDYYLRYCPCCVSEDRKKYGECYFHIEHQIYEVSCCSKHGCKLINTTVSNNQHRDSSLIPLENLVQSLEVVEEDKFIWDINKYVVAVFNEPLAFGDEVQIGKFLTNQLNERYISPRGEQKKLEVLIKDMSYFYKDYERFNISKRRLATIYRDKYLNVFDILIIAYFQKIPFEGLCSKKLKTKTRSEIFDEKVRELSKAGNSMLRIASIMRVDKEVVRQVLLGTYDKPKDDKPRYRCQKWNWTKIDNECCKKMKSLISKNKIELNSISKSKIAVILGLKDKTLRNLPELKKLIRSMKLAKIYEGTKKDQVGPI